MIRIAITGGGTGGHIYPSLSVVRSLRAKLNETPHEFVYIGSASPLEQVLREEVTRYYRVSVGKYRRYFSLKNAADFYRTTWGFFQSLWILFREMPDVVFSKGGYVSVPVVLAAWVLRIPVVLHESDSVPGSSNRLLGKFANRVAVGFPSASGYFTPSQLIVTGNPVEPDIFDGNKDRILTKYGFTSSRPVILVYGGSQGSQSINYSIVAALGDIMEFAQVIHQTGDANIEEVNRESASKAGVKSGDTGYRAVAFLQGEDRFDAFAAADLVISRSGAASMAEFAALRKVCILVPLPGAANDHQKMNAYAFAKEGGALVLEEGNLTKNLLVEKVKKLLFSLDLRQKMSENIARFFTPQSADVIADVILSLIRNRR